MRVLIVEDEAAASRRLEKLILQIDPSVKILDKIDSIEGVIKWWQTHIPPDLLFLDIHLADGSSFELFSLIKIEKPVIFTTAYDQYAIKAFKVNAVDYLLKPIKIKELEEALAKFNQLRDTTIDYQKLADSLSQKNSPKRFLIRLGQHIKVIQIDEVAYFYTENKITFLVTKDGKRYPVDYSLEKIEEFTDPGGFFRINRQFIIHLDSIKEMYAYSKSRVKIELTPPIDQETIVSTERSPHFKKWLIGE